MNMRVSVVVCTYNRASYLRKAIQSLVDQTCAADRFELLVIDNASTDHTKRVTCEEFAGQPNLRYVYEPVSGLSKARNTGLAEAKSDIVAYLDDDAIADPDWVERTIDAFEQGGEKLGAIGGKADLIWEAPRPDWVPEHLEFVLTRLDISSTPITLAPHQTFVGANMAFRRSVLEQVGGFNEKLGRTGKKLISNEELLLQREIDRRGYTRLYDPTIRVHHHVPVDRLDQDWFLRRFYWQGASDAIMQARGESLRPHWRLRLAARVIKSLLSRPRNLVRLMRATDSPDTFGAKCINMKDVGFVCGMLGIAR